MHCRNMRLTVPKNSWPLLTPAHAHNCLQRRVHPESNGRSDPQDPEVGRHEAGQAIQVILFPVEERVVVEYEHTFASVWKL